jgi:hypothetical protein
VELLAGFRYLELDEGLGVAEVLAVDPQVPLLGGNRFQVLDQFDAQNRYYGGQLGARAEYRQDRFFVDFLGKLALGWTHEVVGINGSTVIASPGGQPAVGRGGLLAQPTNSGHWHRDAFAVLPEVGVTVGYQVNQYLRAFLGYSFLYLSSVARPGDQIDRSVNISQAPLNQGTSGLVGPARPVFVFKDTDFWVQGINFGMEVRF